MNLWDIPAIDQHAHNVLKPDALESLPYPAAFTESNDSAIVKRHASHTLFFRRSLREITELLSCEPTQEAVAARRRELGIDALTARCLQAANVASIYLDDGFLPDKTLPLEWHRQFVPVRRILRLEHLAEKLMDSEVNFDVFLERFLSRLDPPPAEVAALKSIAAYRSGLDISLTSYEQARSCFWAMKEHQTENGLRLTAKPLIDFLLTEALRLAAKHHLPVQFHTGFGDPDLDLRMANPLHLRTLLVEPAWRDATIVLLHAGYPFVREAGYLAAMYSQVYVDFGLAVPFLSIAGMKSVLQQLLELTPTTKLLYSSDAHMVPELFYLGAKWGREALAQVLEEAISDGDLTAAEAETAAERILLENAQELYSA